MIRFDERTGYLFPTDLGRTSSQFYIKYDTIEIFNELLQPVKNEAEIIAMISRASEFEQLKVRDDEMDELDDLTHEWCQVNFRYCMYVCFPLLIFRSEMFPSQRKVSSNNDLP